MRKVQAGFTLIELVVVIVILGILSAVALPRFIGISSDARVASANGLFGAVQAAAGIAHAQGLVKGVTNGTITMEGQSVTLVNGYPATATGGIDSALTSFQGFSYSGGVFSQTGAPTASTCGVTYAQPAAANGSPTITLNTAGCS